MQSIQVKWLVSEEQFRKTDLKSAIVKVAGAPAKCGARLSIPCEREVTSYKV
jgi:hypothetical protein